jgi:hypothetical protein
MQEQNVLEALVRNPHVACVREQATSAAMLALVAAAVVSTVSLSAIAVKNAQAEAPSPAAVLSGLLAPPTFTPRC